MSSHHTAPTHRCACPQLVTPAHSLSASMPSDWPPPRPATRPAPVGPAPPSPPLSSASSNEQNIILLLVVTVLMLVLSPAAAAGPLLLLLLLRVGGGGGASPLGHSAFAITSVSRYLVPKWFGEVVLSSE